MSFDVWKGVDLHWLDGAAADDDRGVSWGVPWPQGTIQKDDDVSRSRDADGNNVPIQTWPLAYWPDGSIKWTGVAAVIGPQSGTELKLMPAGWLRNFGPHFSIAETDDAIEIATASPMWRIGRSGTDLVQSISIGGTGVARNGRLVGEIEDRTDWDTDHMLRVKTIRQRSHIGRSGTIRPSANRREESRASTNSIPAAASGCRSSCGSISTPAWTVYGWFTHLFSTGTRRRISFVGLASDLTCRCARNCKIATCASRAIRDFRRANATDFRPPEPASADV